MLSLTSLHPAWNAVIFAAAAGVVWVLGTRLTHYSKEISDRLGGHQSVIGVVLLGGIVSLPEASTSIFAAAIGNPMLGVSTLMGGVAIVTVILAIVDGIRGSASPTTPLTMNVNQPVILLEGILVILILCLTAAGIVVGDRRVPGLGVGVWSTLILCFYFCSMVLSGRFEKSRPWIPLKKVSAPLPSHESNETQDKSSNLKLTLKTGLSGVAIILAGSTLAATGDALGRQTGLGSGMTGLILGGVATSLPELSITLAAVRLNQFEMAFSEIFGTNLFSIMLLFFVDLTYSGDPILNDTTAFSVFSVLLGIALTGIYVAGLVVRRNITILGMGVDSFLVILTFIGGVAVLYGLRGA